MITVYGYPNTRTARVTWMLEELGVNYEYQFIDLMKGEAHSSAYKAINPGAKVPALSDGGLVITESAAIVAYLGDKYGKEPLVPKAGTAERAHYEQWACFSIAELEQPLWTMGKHKFALPKEHRVAAVLKTAAWEFQTALGLLSLGLGDKAFILGDNFSGADIILGHTLFWAIAFKQPIEQENLAGYIDRLMGRSARLNALKREEQAQQSI